MNRHDQVFGLVWFALGIVIVSEAFRLGLWKDGSPGSGFVLLVVGVLLGSSGIILAGSASLVKGKQGGDNILWGNLKGVAPMLIALFIYIFILPSLGFLLATFLFQFFLLKSTAPKQWLAPMVTSLLIVFFCHLVFSYWFQLQLPKGIFGIG